MKVRVGDVIYDGNKKPVLGDLLQLKQQKGVGWGSVLKQLARVTEEPMLVLLDDENFVLGVVYFIWLTRLRAGERDVTCEQILSTIDLDQFELLFDDDDGGGEAPTSAPTGSDRGDAKPAKKQAKASTKTSSSRSTAD